MLLGAVANDGRPALAIGGEVDARRRIGDAEFFGQHVALEEAALAAAIFLRPGHADPAFRRDTLGEFLGVRAFLAASRVIRVERAFGDLFSQERTRFAPQDLAGFRQADRIEGEG